MYQNHLSQVEIQGLQRVVSAYHLISDAAVLVITGVIPVDLLAKERKAIYLRKAKVGKEMAS